MSYLKDIDSVQSYSGAAWVAVGGGAINSNIIINGNFTINQRSYVSAANLASGAYGFDRWKSNFTNTTLTFTSAPAGQSVTINDGGGLQQIVEQANVPAGSYTLSFTGTATGRIYNSGATPPSYAASPISFTADGLADVVVEFTASGSTKTLSKVKLETGTSATSFVYAGGTIEGELANCQRYYFRSNNGGNAFARYGLGRASSATNIEAPIYVPVQMRIPPTSVDFSSLTTTTANGITAIALNQPTANVAFVDCTSSSLTLGQAVVLMGNNSTGAYLGFSAEL
jgi:hypothetical protein